MSAVKQKKTPLYRYYETYEKRFQTFKNWPGIANPRLLALAGFFSTDTADQVRCFSCGIGIKCWDSSCDPWSEHLRWRPKCEYLKTGYPAYSNEKLRIGYSSFEKRLMSFTASWPGTEFQDPVQMANAGFFYLGYGDHVQCYCCNIHVHSWEKQDIPIREHERWKPTCGHLRERLLLESKREKELQHSKNRILKPRGEAYQAKKYNDTDDFEADCPAPGVTNIYDLGNAVTIRTEEENSAQNLHAVQLTRYPKYSLSTKKTFGGKQYLPVSTSITGSTNSFADTHV